VGHSERRALGENDAFINRKVRAVLAEGLVVVLCVGEPLSVRKKGLAAAKRFVARQLGAAWEGIERSKVRRLVVAYEPVWAIGTGRSDSPREAAEMARYIKAFTARRFHSSPLVLYGGSVTSRNARSFFHESGIDGALVGSASLKVGDFRKIVAAAL
jgi:triosephosphate isomerase